MAAISQHRGQHQVVEERAAKKTFREKPGVVQAGVGAYPNVLTPLEARGRRWWRGSHSVRRNKDLAALAHMEVGICLAIPWPRLFLNAVEFVHLIVKQIPPKCKSIKHSIKTSKGLQGKQN